MTDKGAPEGCEKKHVTQCLELAGSCEELSGFIKAEQFLDQLCNYWLRNKDFGIILEGTDNGILRLTHNIYVPHPSPDVLMFI